MTFTPEQVRSLSAPLNSSHVKEREQGGRKVSYVEGWHAIAEANRIFGFDGWQRETVLLQETNRDLVTIKPRNGSPYDQWRIGYIAKVRVTVGNVVREGTGYGSGMGKPEAIGDAVEGAIKEAETDAMKRALMTFGNPFGLALYDKTQANVTDEPEQPQRPESGYPKHVAAIKAATSLEALQTAFLAARADKTMSADEARDCIKIKDQRKLLLTTPVEPNFDSLSPDPHPEDSGMGDSIY